MFDRWILWINKRNNTYIKEFNPEKGIRLANNKIETKKFLTQRWIPIAQTIAHIKNRNDRLNFDFDSIENSTFVIKPNKGSKGKWIFVIKERKKQQWAHEFLIGDKRVNENDLKNQAVEIFDGAYSSSNKLDTILIEDRLIPGSWFLDFCEYGLADIRIIIFNLVPIIAMLRMPTKESGGKANLAQWWIGLWLDIVTGKITSLYRQEKSYTTEFPDERKHVKNKKIPYRQEIIQYSANAQYFVNIGYLGMDRVITNKWPKLLEINARAGLEIQNITGKPLLSIMKKIEDLDITTPEKGIEISKSLFSDERINEVREQNIVYLSQTWRLVYKKDNKKRALAVTVNAWIDKLQNYTSEKVFKKILWAESVNIDLWHHDKIFKNISLTSSDKIKGNKIILWQQSLENYYIKPIHKSNVNTRIINPNCLVEEEVISLKILDEKIRLINKSVNLAQILKPTNYLDEFDAFVSHHGNYNPQFTYKFPSYKELNAFQDEINELNNKYRIKEQIESSFANIFFDKLDELQIKINLIKAYKKQNFWQIDHYNKILFGEIDNNLLALSKQKIDQWIHFWAKELWRMLHDEEIISYIREYINKKWIIGVRVKKDYFGLSKIAVWCWKYATIKVKDTAMVREYKLISKLVHEVDIHAMRYLNGKKTWWNILATGTASYLETEEWIAVYLANKKLQEYIPWYDGIAKYKNYYRVDQASRLNFAELGECVRQTKDAIRGKNKRIVNYKSLFNTLLKFTKGKKDTSIKNTGIIFGKNLVYLSGYQKIKNHLEANGKLDNLLKYGKTNLKNISFFK